MNATVIDINTKTGTANQTDVANKTLVELESNKTISEAANSTNSTDLKL